MNASNKINDRLTHLKANFKIWCGKVTENKFQELDGYIERINAFNDQRSHLTQKHLLQLDRAMDRFDELTTSLQKELEYQL